MPVASLLSGFVGESPKKTSPVFRRSDRQSHAPFHPGVDMDLIHPAGDNGTVLLEEELMGRNYEEEGMLFRVKVLDPMDRLLPGKKSGQIISESHLPRSEDFRQGIDVGECQCGGDTVCLQCCTSRDLADVPELYLEHIKTENHRPKAVGGALEMVFDILMPRFVAENIGLVSQAV